MPFDRNRRRLLKTLASATVASAAGAVTPIAPAWAQNPAPRRGSPRLTFSRVVAGIEPILHRSGLMLRDLPAAPAIRVSSAVDLVYLSAVTAYPADVDPWNPGSFRVPFDLGAEQKLLT